MGPYLINGSFEGLGSGLESRFIVFLVYHEGKLQIILNTGSAMCG